MDAWKELPNDLRGLVRLALVSVFCVCAAQPACLVAGQQDNIAQTPSQDTVVKLFGAGLGNLDSYGSGTLITPQGHVLTIWNHLINTGYLTAVTSDGSRYEVDVIGTSRDFDVAVLKLKSGDDATFPFVDLGSSVEATPGQSVLAFSNMYHVATGAEPVSMVHGVIAQRVPIEAGLGRWKFPYREPVYLVDAVINNSGAGGGLLTTSGGAPVGLIGREIQLTATDTWVNYAMPLTELAPVVNRILSGDTVDSTVMIDPENAISDRELTARFGITLLPSVVQRTPCYIDVVVRDSPAEKAGLQAGDLIVLLDDAVVQSVLDFRTMLASRRPGQPVRLMVQRRQQLLPIQMRVPQVR